LQLEPLSFRAGESNLKEYRFQPFDILVFPIIDWHYRFQRPQQIAARLASHGHRVFYLRTYFLEGTSPKVQPIRNDIPVFDVQFGLPLPRSIVADQLDEPSKQTLLEQVGILCEDFNILKAIAFVDLPFWGPLALELQKRYGWKIIYDSLDHLGGFSNITPYMLEPEAELIRKSDMVLTTSHLLYNEKVSMNTKCILVPNATDFDHFNYSSGVLPEELATIQKPIVGYYGAISDWFDIQLLMDLASARPRWSFILIGRVENIDISPLQQAHNVFLLGEKPYGLLPSYLHYFDACIIPFKKLQLTQATNPVKLFEYLSAGKSIVATDLDELRYYREYVRLASSAEEWLRAIELALDDYSPARVEERLRFARQNTWEERMFSIEDAIQALERNNSYVSESLPHILPEENLISSRLLTRHNGIDYWCLVYEKDGVLYKQTSLDLAEREARFLSQLESDYFPKYLDVHSEPDYSLITFKKVHQQHLKDAFSQINLSVEELYGFIQHCLNILVQLKEKGITHRNICRNTVVIQNGKPVLLDFDWAISTSESYFAPVGLGGYERSRDDRFSDVYSIGKILEYVNRQHYRTFDHVISLMTQKDAVLRIDDLDILKLLFHMALKTSLLEENH
jgi:glycosyltransferase involved in cell wall biosynthesis/tRNA A-37 threonylcarbamoyl transferase component Bud32